MSGDLEKMAEGTGLVASGGVKQQIVEMFKAGRPGFEEPMKPNEVVIPRVKLLQGLSPEVQEDSRNFYSGLIINSLTKEQLPETFVPIFKTTSWVRFNPRDAKDPNFNPEFKPGDVVWRSSDPEDPRVKAESVFGEDGSNPVATTFMNFLAYFTGSPMPLMLSFSKTSFRTGKELLNMARYSGGAMFSRRYALSARKETNDKGTYHVYTVKPVGPADPDEVEIGKIFYDGFFEFRSNLKTHEEAPEE